MDNTVELRRHLLLRLAPAAWDDLRPDTQVDADADARAVWQAQGLPLVVARQLAGVAGRVCLGWPLPACWGRRRISLQAPRHELDGSALFPTLAELQQRQGPNNALPVSALSALQRDLAAVGVLARVYGSYGWQLMTGMGYVHAGSDIDLLMDVHQQRHGRCGCCGVGAATARIAAVGRRILLCRRFGLRVARMAGLAQWPNAADSAKASDRSRAAGQRSLAGDAGVMPCAGGRPMIATAVTRSAPSRLGDTAPWVPETMARRIGRAAIAAMYDELALSPKPGLVSFEGSGSHCDMDASTFMRSLYALRPYFAQITQAGACGAGFSDLQGLGRQAETQMLQATGGVNTHRGAIFMLGVLCASAGALAALGLAPRVGAVRRHLMATWGLALRARCAETRPSNGRDVVRQLGLRGALEEAVDGFPVLFEVVFPALNTVLARGGTLAMARSQALFAGIAALDDTNLAHRGGLAGLRWAQRQARDYLDRDGVFAPDAARHARAIDAAFVARRLSPGGSADLLAAACWLHRVGSI